MISKTVVTAACLGLAFLAFAAGAEEGDATARKQADAIFTATGIKGGLVVHVGCGDGRLTAALRKDESYVVHGLETNPARVDGTRKHIRSLGLYGPVSVETFDGKNLPYTDNLVNMVVASGECQVAREEITRVLVPGGVALFLNRQSEIENRKWVKPPREGVDEWTHFLHDASGNPVAHDTVVGPPRHLQWHAGPRHGRSHEYTPSINAVVSTAGRIFYIADQGPIATLRKPAEWKLLARDAYNGLPLWERPIGKWFSHLCGWTQGPRQLQRKLVAVGERVYVTLGFHAPLSALDATTGETVKVYPDTEGVEEILCHKGVLLLAVREVTDARLTEYKKWERLTAQTESPLHLRDPRTPLVSALRRIESQAPLTVLALDAATGNVLWKQTGDDAAGLRQLSLRACGDRVYCMKRGGLHCFDLKTGKTVWAKQSDPLRAVSEDAVVCVSKQKIALLSPEDGRPRWSQPPTLANVRDVLFAGGSLWIGGGKPYDSGNPRHTGPSWGAYFAVERDLATGDVIKEITAENPKHHHRCYDNKATDRYILGGRRGTEFLDLESGDYLWNSWARGTCRYGVMPSNGMLYVPPHACGCYITVKLMGFNALAPARESGVQSPESRAARRLERGPAYAALSDLQPPASGRQPSSSWPTYRGDAQRSGRALCAVPTALTQKWQTEIDAPLTAPTAADGKVFVACPDRHELQAIDSSSGKTAWTFTTGGRIDSPPTIHKGQVLFGCCDGYVYSLRAVDGALAWRFRGARDSRRIVANGQIESASPIHGSVLVEDGTFAFTAGRSSYLDGGLDLYRLDPATGEMLSKTEIHSPDPETGRQPKQYGPNTMPGARSEILAADDQYLYLRDLTFTKEGTEVSDRKPHLFTMTDFLDDTWTHRSYWIFGTKSSISTGCSGRDRKLLYGRILVHDDTTVYGYGREVVHWSSEFEDGPYRIFARRRDADKPHWSKPVPVHVRAMVLSGDIIFAAGAGPAPGKAPEKQGVSPTPLLLAISASDGAELARYPIPAAPVFNGIAAAGSELFLTLENGRFLCLTGR
ncbi:MAG: PQQ-binding-like beta-propeller repeat protein [Pirellulaceae bacterium]|nr:PQQ-binding-like beta-propeller repeat protein [Pirellulaceae bacterium]